MRKKRDEKEAIQSRSKEIIDLAVIQKHYRVPEYLRLHRLSGSLPLSFYDAFSHLRILNLRGCRVNYVPGQITRLVHLRHLDVTGNHGITLNWQVQRLNLQRLVGSSSIWERENYRVMYSSLDDDPSYRKTLLDLCADEVIQSSSLLELDEAMSLVPVHLQSHLLAELCAECGSVTHNPIIRTRRAIINFQDVPVQYTFCRPLCLSRKQETWEFEETLNSEKRALRQLKFGPIETQTARYVAST